MSSLTDGQVARTAAHKSLGSRFVVQELPGPTGTVHRAPSPVRTTLWDCGTFSAGEGSVGMLLSTAPSQGEDKCGLCVSADEGGLDPSAPLDGTVSLARCRQCPCVGDARLVDQEAASLRVVRRSRWCVNDKRMADTVTRGPVALVDTPRVRRRRARSKRGFRTTTVGGCVITGVANGRCGGNWMKPDPTTRCGFCEAHPQPKCRQSSHRRSVS